MDDPSVAISPTLGNDRRGNKILLQEEPYSLGLALIWEATGVPARFHRALIKLAGVARLVDLESARVSRLLWVQA